jgi:hypothetical protein
MMPDLNWWLMALAFLLGLLLTFAMMIRRVTREVPTGLAPAAADSFIEEIPASETGTETGTGAGTEAEAEKHRRS